MTDSANPVVNALDGTIVLGRGLEMGLSALRQSVVPINMVFACLSPRRVASPPGQTNPDGLPWPEPAPAWRPLSLSSEDNRNGPGASAGLNTEKPGHAVSQESARFTKLNEKTTPASGKPFTGDVPFQIGQGQRSARRAENSHPSADAQTMPPHSLENSRERRANPAPLPAAEPPGI